MRKFRFLALIFCVLIAVSGFAQTQTESKGNFFFEGGFYSSIFNDQSIELFSDWTLYKYSVVKLGGGYEFPLKKGYTALGLEAGFASGTSFGGAGKKNFIPITLTGAYMYPVVKDVFYLGPKLKLGGVNVSENSLNMFLLGAVQLEAELRIPVLPLGLYVGGGVDLFPTGYKFGAAPVIGLGLRFPRPTSTPEPSLGRVEVSSAVPGEVLLNSRPSGSTVATGGTVTIDNVAAGRVEVAVREDDGSIVKASGPVTVRRNQTTVVRIDRPLGRINVSSAIPGEVLIDGKGTSGFVTSSGGNVTINNVEAGIVEVAIKDADGSIVKAREPVTVLQDQVISVQIERPVGSIALTSAVPGEVLINSNPTGSTVPANGTITIGNVNIGNAEVGVRETNGQISRAPNTVTVLQDQITPVRIDRSVGSVAVTSAIPGEILIDGRGTGTTVATNGTVTIANVGVGNVEVAVRETNGQITRAPSAVTIRQDQTAAVRIDRPVGRIAVTSAIPGEILINGNGTGTSVATNGTVTINNVNVGNAEVGVRETNGQITRAPSVVTVRQDQTTSVRIDRASQDPRANPAGGFDIFRADGSSAAGFRVEEPTGGSGEFTVFRPDDYENWLLSPIYFEPDSATLVETYRPVLESVRRYLAANPNLRLLIRAYTAPFGTAEGRQMVSEWRADFSRDYMTQNGIAGNRIRTELYGSERIPEQVTTASSWVSYRCAELIIY